MSKKECFDNKNVKTDEITIKFNSDVAKRNGIFNNGDQYVMYILINDDLKMDTGKLISFCCRSVCKVMIENEKLSIKQEGYNKWVNNFEPIIVLKAKESDLLYCINKYSNIDNEIWCHNIIDLGRTNISPFSLTVVAFTPIMRNKTPEFIGNLREL